MSVGGAPTSLVASPVANSETSLSVSFTASTGGNPAVTGYQFSVDSGLTFTNATNVSATQVLVTGLAPGTSYSVILRAVSGTAWTSVNSAASTAVSTYKFGSIPIITDASAISSTSLSVFFTASTGGNPALTKYQYSVDLSNVTFADVTGTSSPFTITGLTSGTSYRLAMRAVSGSTWTTAKSNSIPFTFSASTSLAPLSISSALTTSVHLVVTDSSGQTVCAANGTTIVKSTNYGSTWTTSNTHTQDSESLAMNADGTRLYKGCLDNKVYFSTNSGNSWTASNTTITWPRHVKCNSTGIIVYAASWNGGIWKSDNSGVDWTNISGANMNPRYWQTFSISDDGKYLIAGEQADGYFLSDNSGSTWRKITTVSNGIIKQPISTALSGTGQYGMFTDNPGSGNRGLFLTSDYGVTWTLQTSFSFITDTWSYCTINYAGNNMYVHASQSGGSYKLYNSSDYGATWTLVTSAWTGRNSAYSNFSAISYNGLKSYHINYTNNTLRSVSFSSAIVVGSAPASVVASPIANSETTLSVSFAASTGGTPAVTGYQYSIDSGNTFTNATSVSATQVTITGLSGGTYYSILLRAVSGTDWTSPNSDFAYATTYKFGTIPTLNTVTGLDGSENALVVNFSGSTGGRPNVTKYQYSIDASNVTFTDVSGLSSPFTITGLTSGTNYNVAIRAVSATYWTTAKSNVIVAKTNKIGTAPTSLILSAVAFSQNTLRLAFTDSSGGFPALTKYQYSLESSGNNFLDASGTTSPLIIYNLSAGTSYTIRLRAVSGTAWTSTTSTSSAVSTYKIGSNPQITNITGVNGTETQLSVTYTDSSGGSPNRSKYQYSINGGSTFTDVSGGGLTSPLIIYGLSGGNTYNVVIKAVALDGSNVAWDASSNTFTGTTYKASSPPTDLSASPINTFFDRVQVTFTDASFNGVPGRTKYQYALNAGAYQDASGNASPLIIYNLSAGATYTIKLRAASGTAWTSADSSSVSVTVYKAGATPTSVVASPIYDSETTLSVNFTDPSGGVPTRTKYQYSLDGTNFLDVSGLTPIPFIIYGLSAGTSYTIRVRAVSGSAWTSSAGTASAVSTYKIGSNPQITNITGVNGTETQLSVSYTDTSGGVPTRSKYQYSVNGGSTFTDVSGGGLTSPLIIYGLSGGNTYNVVLKAVALDGSNVAWDASSNTFTGTTYKANSPLTNLIISTINNYVDRVQVTFTDAFDGVPGKTKYQYALNAGAYQDASGTASPLIIYNLSAGATYTIKLRAVSGTAWFSADSSSVSVSLYNPGSAPSNLVASSISNSQNSLRLTFTDSSGGVPALTKYQYSLDGTNFVDASGTTSPLIITGLSAATSYTIQLRAVSGSAWTSTASNFSSASTYKIGSNPQITNITGVNGTETQLSVSYTDSSGGSPNRSKYQYSVNGGSTFTDVSGGGLTSPLIIYGLSGGNIYNVVLKAVALDGSNVAWDASSNTVQGTTYKASSPLTNLIASGVDTFFDRVRVTFTDAFDGVPGRTKYQYALDAGAYQDASGTASPLIIYNLSAGVSYNIKLRAVSGTAWFSADSSSVSVTVYKAGTAPSSVVAAPINNSETTLSVNFTDSSGGVPTITKYQYSLNSGSTYLDASGTSKPLIIYNLSGGIPYTIRLRAVSGTAWISADSTDASATTYKLGSVPTLNNVTRVNGSETSLLVDFSGSTGGVPNVSKYQYTTDASNANPIFTDVSGLSSPFTISGLSGGITYNVAIRAVSDGAWTTNKSNSISTRTNKIGSEPLIISLTPVLLSQTTLRISFTDSSGGYPNLTGYQYSIDNGTTYLDASATTSPIIIDNLSPGTYYTVKIRAISGTSWVSPAATSSSVQTYKFGPNPQITNITGVNGTETQLSVTYTDSSGGIPNRSKYQYSINSGSTYFDVSGGGLTSPLIIYGLSGGNTYNVVIKAVALDGSNVAWDASSNIFQGTTYKAGTAPSGVFASSVNGSETTLDVSFNDSSGGIPALTKYQYSIDASGLTFYDASGTTSPIRIYDLSAGSSYTVRLRAVSGNAWTSGVSNSSVASTNGIGLPPSGITINPIYNSETTVLVTYNVASGGNPLPTKYQYSLDGSSTYFDVSGSIANPTINPFIIYGLSAGTSYVIRLRAVSGTAWTSVDSSAVSVTTNKVGSALTDLSASPINNNFDRVQVTFMDVSNGFPGRTKYQYALDGGAYQDACGNASPLTIYNLSGGVSYNIKLRAVSGNLWASADSSSVSVKTYKAGTAPSGVFASSVNGSETTLDVSFNDSSGGYPVLTKYQYSIDASGLTFYDASGTTSPIRIYDLSAGSSYTVRLRAVSGNAWTSGVSNSSVASTNGIGLPPSGITINPIYNSETTVLVTYNVASGGNPLPTKYQYSLDGSSTYFDVSGSIANPTINPFIIYNLSAGTSYVIRLRAVSGTAWTSVDSSAVSVTTNKVGTAPTDLSASAVDGYVDRVRITFTDSSGGVPALTKYTYSLNGGAFQDASGTSNPLIIYNLSAGNNYSIKLRAVSGTTWTSVDSSAVSVTTNKVGTAPTSVAASPINNSETTLSVSFIDSSGGIPPITKYQYSLDNGSNYLDVSGLTLNPFIIYNLSAGTQYTVKMRAVSGTAWTSPESVASLPVSTNKVGTPLTDLSATAIDGYVDRVRITFTDSSGGVPALTKYTYSLNGGAFQDASGTSNPLVIYGLSAGTNYSIKLKAVSGSAWTSVDSSAVSVTTNKVGTAPTDLSASAVDGYVDRVKISFTDSSGGVPLITKYQYALDGGAFQDASGNASPLTIYGLSAETTYTIKLRAVSGTAWFSADSSSVSVKTYKAGSAPSNVVASAVNNSETTLSVNFTDSSGGYPPITKYQYSLDNGSNYLDVSGLTLNPFIIYNLSAGTQYTVKVRAVSGNAWTSAESVASNPARTYKLGTKPVITSITKNVGNSISVSFTQSDVGVNAPVYYYSLNGTTVLTDASASSSPLVITGLTSNTAYSVYLVARNNAGDVFSDPSLNVSVLGTVPTLSAVSQVNNIRVTFGQTNTGTTPVTYYYSNDGITRNYPVTTPTFDISGSVQRTIYVIADNSAGSVVSAGITALPYRTGSVPIVNIQSGLNKLTVSFSQTDLGTTPVTYYYSYSSNGTNPIGPVTSPFEITNILTTKTIYVIANNIAGNVLSAAASGTPYVIGSAPVITSITSGTNSLIVNFDGSTGGYPEPPSYYYSLDGGAYIDANTTSSPITITGLTVQKQYDVKIVAKFLGGFTSDSNTVTGSPSQIQNNEVVVVVKQDQVSNTGGSFAQDRKTFVQLSAEYVLKLPSSTLRTRNIRTGILSQGDVITRKRLAAIGATIARKKK